MNHDHSQNGRWNAVSKYVFIGFALIAGYFLITEHRAHVVQYLPFLLLAACPLMHLFHGHGGHGGHGGDSKADGGSEPKRSAGISDSAPAGKSQGPEQHHHH